MISPLVLFCFQGRLIKHVGELITFFCQFKCLLALAPFAILQKIRYTDSIWELSGTFEDINPYHDKLCYGIFWKNDELHYDFYDSWNEASAGMAKRIKEDGVSNYRLWTNTIWKALWKEFEFYQFLALMARNDEEYNSCVDKATEIASYMLDPV